MPAISTNRWDELNPPEIGHWTPRLRASVVVPYYDSLAALRRTLLGLAAQTYPADLTEIVVVDDGSPRPLDQASIDDLTPAEIVTRDDEGFTLAAARNQGAASSRGDVLVFLDHDMLPDPGWLECHMRWHHIDQPRPILVLGSRSHVDDAWLTEGVVADAVAAGGLAATVEGRTVEVPEWIEFHLERTSRLTSADEDIFRIVTGGNVSITRAFFEDIGGFDTSFVRWGGEDTELGYRAWVSGALLIPEQGAHCWHQGLGVVPDDSERSAQQVQQRKLAHLIPLPGFRSDAMGRTWRRPRVVAEVIGTDREGIGASIESLLAVSDVSVFVSSDDPMILEDFGPDPRVEVGAVLRDDSHRFSPFRAIVPAGLTVSESLWRSLIDEARRTGAAETRDGVRLESQRHTRSNSARTSPIDQVAGRARRPSNVNRALSRVKRIRSLPDAIRAVRWLAGSVMRRLRGSRAGLGGGRSGGVIPVSRRLESDAWSRVVAIDVPGLPATGRLGDERIDLVVTAEQPTGSPAPGVRHLSLSDTSHPDLLAYPPLDPQRALGVLQGDDEASDPLSRLLRGLASLGDPPPGSRTSAAHEMASSMDHDGPAALESIRRAVLAEHLPVMRLDQLCSAAGLPSPAPMVSVILASRREDNLAAAVEAIVSQTYPHLELILATHGIDLLPTIEGKLQESGIHYEVVGFSSQETFGSVLATATQLASGRLIAKMDDDDLYSCSHVEDLVIAHLLSGADVVGKGAEFVRLERSDVTIRRFVGGAYTRSRTIAGGAMAVTRQALDRAGGWADVPRHVDQALIRDVLRSGGTVFRTHGFGYVLVRHGDHTWQSDEEVFLDQAEEKWAGLPDWIVGDYAADACQTPVSR